MWLPSRPLLAAPTANSERGQAIMSKDPRVYLAHIMECIQKIERFTEGGKERFLQDELIQDAVLRNFEVIGEAAKRLDDVYRADRPEIPWRAVAGLRDVLIHQYEEVDVAKIWAIVEKTSLASSSPLPTCSHPWSSSNANWQARKRPPRRSDEMLGWAVGRFNEGVNKECIRSLTPEETSKFDRIRHALLRIKLTLHETFVEYYKYEEIVQRLAAQIP